VGLYRAPSEFTARNDCSIQEKYGAYPGVERAFTPDGPDVFDGSDGVEGLGGHGDEPKKIVTDKLRSYGVAHREVIPEAIHDNAQYANNRAAQSHEATRVRERGMRKFKSVRHAQRFLGAHAAVYNLFNFGRHLVRAEHYRDLRVSAFEEWGRAVA
jgi:hypothetical protein